MGKVVSYLKRPFINYAIEAKTESLMKKLETQKPTAHPLYPTEQRVLNSLRHDHPELKDKIKAKSEKLDAFLKQVKVQSHDLLLDSGHDVKGADPKRLPEPIRPLGDLGVPPEHREDVKLSDGYGLADPPADRIPPGKISFRQTVQLLQMISAKDADQKLVEDFALEQFKFEPEKTRLLLKYFKPFAIASNYERVRRTTEAERVEKGQPFPEFKSEMDNLRSKIPQQLAESEKRMKNIRRGVKNVTTANDASKTTQS